MTRRLHYWAVRRPIPTNLKLIPIAEFAVKVHLSVSGVRDLIARNKLYGYKIRGRWFLPVPPENWIPYAHTRGHKGKNTV
jgi:hypothetical protein